MEASKGCFCANVLLLGKISLPPSKPNPPLHLKEHS